VDGDQAVFARFRFRVNGGLVPGATYTVTWPLGVKTFVASATGTINFTDDQGCGATPPACNFTSVLTTTNAGPLLGWDSGATAGFIGNPNIDHAITGSPFGTNFLRIDGPNVGGPGINTVTQTLFSVTGKLFNGVLSTPLTADRTSYTRTATAGPEIDLFSHSTGNATITATATGIPTTTLTGDPASGRFFAGLNLAAGAALPAFIRYTAASTGNDSTIRDVKLVDEVTVTSATWSESTHTLTVNAVSSDQVTPPTLVATGSPTEPLGTLAAGILSVALVAPPFEINVNSSAGGTGSLLVDLIP